MFNSSCSGFWGEARIIVGTDKQPNRQKSREVMNDENVFQILCVTGFWFLTSWYNSSDPEASAGGWKLIDMSTLCYNQQYCVLNCLYIHPRHSLRVLSLIYSSAFSSGLSSIVFNPSRSSQNPADPRLKLNLICEKIKVI